MAVCPKALLSVPVFSIYKVYFSLHQKLRERLLLDITSAKWNPQRSCGRRNSVQKLSGPCNFVHVGCMVVYVSCQEKQAKIDTALCKSRDDLKTYRTQVSEPRERTRSEYSLLRKSALARWSWKGKKLFWQSLLLCASWRNSWKSSLQLN